MKATLILLALTGTAALTFAEPDTDTSQPPPAPVEEKPTPGSEATMKPETQPMDNAMLAKLIAKLDPDANWGPGSWHFTFKNIEFYCITDESADRMRIMTSIKEISEVNSEEIIACMVANYDRALDARYCINGGHLWGAFIHPLRDLTPALFLSAVAQVGNVRTTFGTVYSSGHLLFDGGKEKDVPEENESSGGTPKDAI